MSPLTITAAPFRCPGCDHRERMLCTDCRLCGLCCQCCKVLAPSATDFANIVAVPIAPVAALPDFELIEPDAAPPSYAPSPDAPGVIRGDVVQSFGDSAKSPSLPPKYIKGSLANDGDEDEQEGAE